MPNPSWVDALAGLFENPLFQFGANLSALSGKHRFGEAFGGAVAATGKTVTAAKKQKKLEELQAESLGIKKDYNALLKSKVEAEALKEKGQAAASTQLMAALANLPGVSPAQRLLWNYQLQKGVAPQIGLTPAQQATLDLRRQTTPYQDWMMKRYGAEDTRKALEQTQGVAALGDYEAVVNADPNLSAEEKAARIFQARSGKSVAQTRPLAAKAKNATEQAIIDAINAKKAIDAGGGNGEAPPEGPGLLDTMGGAVKNWWQGPSWIPGGAPATPLAPPQQTSIARDGYTAVPMTGAVSPVTPLAPPTTPGAGDPAELLSGLEAQLKVLSPVERGMAKVKLQQLLANPALAGLHERIRGLVGQL